MYQNISNQEFSKLTEEGKVIVMDVRTPREIAEGYIPAASHFIDINNEPFAEKIQELDPDRDYIVYCRSGARSARACQIMEANGFNGKLYNLGMGIMEWDGEVKTK
jgi:rhodanese-related sulfurtransferase